MKFNGYVRPDGRVGIRNHILVLPSVLCSSETCAQIADQVEGAVTLPNQAGCAQVGDDVRQTKRTLVGFGLNPNVAAVLVVGLGCEGVNPNGLAKQIRESGKPVETLVIQEVGGTIKTVQKGVELVKKLKEYADRIPRREVDLENLIIGVQQGDTDTSTIVAADPAAGVAVDMFIENGGTIYFSQQSELIGPSQVQGVLKYAQLATSSGRFLMDCSGYDVEAITGMIAGGASLIMYTTGKGNPVGSPISPVIKVCGDSTMAAIMSDNIDINASSISTGDKSIREIGEGIYHEIIDVSNGKQTKTEQLGFNEFAIHRILPSF